MTKLPEPLGASKPQAILFDWDNTLVDSWEIIHDALNTTFAAFDKQLWTLDQTKDRVRGSMRESFPAVFGDQWEHAADVFYQRYEKIHARRTQPLSGVEILLSYLQNEKIYLGVVSNKTARLLRKEAGHLGWDHYFEKIIGAGDAERDKPAADPVHLALSGSGVEAGREVWFVGDADVDLECAINLGCVPVLVRQKPPETQEFDNCPPEHYFNDCNALCKFLQTM